MSAEVHDGGRSPSPNPTRVDHSLDELARGLVSGTVSRGKALRWMGSALVGAALASVPGVAWAACPEGQTRCGERCVSLQTDERHCGSCRNRCASNQTCCKGRCVNLQTNERHCGGCFNRCAEGSECVGGVCQCPSGTTLCGGNCVPNCPSGQTRDISTCQCGAPCTIPQQPVLCNGQCIYTGCGPTQTFNPTICECECPSGQVPCESACLPPGSHC